MKNLCIIIICKIEVGQQAERKKTSPQKSSKVFGLITCLSSVYRITTKSQIKPRDLSNELDIYTFTTDQK